MSFQLIQTVTVSGSALSVDFTNIPQDGTDLLITVSGRQAGGNSSDIKFNNSSTGYSSSYVLGNGTSASSGTLTEYGWVGEISYNTDTARTFSNNSIYIPNYSVTGHQKNSFIESVRATSSSNTGGLYILSTSWSGTAAITSIKLAFQSATTQTFVNNSTVSLYKITKGSGGASVSYL